MWTLKWGDHREFLEAESEETGELPPALEAEPYLEPEVEAFLGAFWTLTPARVQGGMGAVGGIPLVEIETYCRMFGVENRERFVEFIRALDGEFLRYIAAHSKQGAS